MTTTVPLVAVGLLNNTSERDRANLAEEKL